MRYIRVLTQHVFAAFFDRILNILNGRLSPKRCGSRSRAEALRPLCGAARGRMTTRFECARCQTLAYCYKAHIGALVLPLSQSRLHGILAHGISVLHLAEDLFKAELSSLSASVDSGGAINPKHLSLRRTYPFDSGVEPKLRMNNVIWSASPLLRRSRQDKISGRDQKGGSA
ncbi:hypothetical protein B0H13DRAFT_1934533 [Mycena leptocephala]|nr:hypothetical protein B0H13DRAFT_1934533 [Mycena leptocephala]